LGASSVCGFDISITFAACVTETVGSPGVAAPEVCATLTFGSLPCVAVATVGVDGALVPGGTSSIAALGGTSAADGGTEPTEAGAEALGDAGADEAVEVPVAMLGEAAVDVTDGASEAGGAMARGAGDSTFVTGGLAVVGAAVVGATGATGATEVTTGACVTCVTGGAGGSTGSTACCVCGGGGASTTGAAGSTAGAFGGACCAGAAASSPAGALGSGAGAVVVMT
jgi:hypothetical protein